MSDQEGPIQLIIVIAIVLMIGYAFYEAFSEISPSLSYLFVILVGIVFIAFIMRIFR